MKNNTTKQKQIPKNNVLSMSQNRKFKPVQTTVEIPLPTSKKDQNLVMFHSNTTRFGFMKDDLVICRIDFKIEDVKDTTLVVVYDYDSSDFTLAVNPPDKSEIKAVVTGFQREVAR